MSNDQFLTRAEGETHQRTLASLNAHVLAMRVLLQSLMNSMELEHRGMFAVLAFEEAEKQLTSVMYLSKPEDQKIADGALEALASMRKATVLKGHTGDYLREHLPAERNPDEP